MKIQTPDTSPIWKTPTAHAAFETWYDGELKRLRERVDVESLFVETRFGATHVLAAGDQASPPLLLVMGLGGNALGWFHQITAFAGDYRVYAPDTPGQPGRSAPIHPSHAGPAFGHWLVDLLDGLGIQQAPVMGVSLGGRMVVKLGWVAPGRVTTAILISPMGFKALKLNLIFKMAPVGMSLRPLSRQEGKSLLGTIMSPSLDIEVSDIRHYFESLLIFGESYRQEGLFAGLPMALPLPEEEVRGCTPPTLVLFGEREMLFNPQAAARKARSLLPNLVGVELVPQVGHFMTYEQSDEINARVMAYLRDGSS